MKDSELEWRASKGNSCPSTRLNLRAQTASRGSPRSRLLCLDRTSFLAWRAPSSRRREEAIKSLAVLIILQRATTLLRAATIKFEPGASTLEAWVKRRAKAEDSTCNRKSLLRNLETSNNWRLGTCRGLRTLSQNSTAAYLIPTRENQELFNPKTLL